jgi:hypothetical protein
MDPLGQVTRRGDEGDIIPMDVTASGQAGDLLLAWPAMIEAW